MWGRGRLSATGRLADGQAGGEAEEHISKEEYPQIYIIYSTMLLTEPPTTAITVKLLKETCTLVN